MDPTALYYALSTIAQCAAALAALIGFLGLWRLDRLREETQHIEPRLRDLMSRTTHLLPGGGQIAGSDRPDLSRVPQWQLYQKVDAVIANPGSEIEQEIKPELETLRQRGRAIPREQQRLTDTLQRFLRRTLLILALAITAIAVARVLNAWVVTRWILWLLIILASISLCRGTASVVREAVRSTRALVVLVLLLALASPALAGTHCMT